MSKKLACAIFFASFMHKSLDRQGSRAGICVEKPCYAKTLLRKDSEVTAHVASFGVQSEDFDPPIPPWGFYDSLKSLVGD